MLYTLIGTVVQVLEHTLPVSRQSVVINEGIKHKTKPFFSTQFHPEASSGPTDTGNLFGVFVENMKTFTKK